MRRDWFANRCRDFLCAGCLTAGLCSRFMGRLEAPFDGSCCIICLVEVLRRCTAAALWFPLQAYLTVPFYTFTKSARSQQRCAERVLFMLVLSACIV